MCFTNSESLVAPGVNEAIDMVEVGLLMKYERIEPDLNHSFGDGLYVREIAMPAGSKWATKIHKKRHPYFVLAGKVEVWTEEKGWVMIQAPHFGWTNPGTRRVLRVIEPTSWITVHANPDDTRDLDMIEDRVIEKHINPLLSNEA